MPHFMFVLIPYISKLNCSWIIKCLFLRNMAACMANSVDPDQMLHSVASDLGTLFTKAYLS